MRIEPEEGAAPQPAAAESHADRAAPRAGFATTAAELAAGIRAQRMRAIGRAISEIERDSQTGRQLVAALADSMGRAHRIGITGPAGAGKSSLIGELIRQFRERGHRVGVIAVDPSSRASGGGVLGDRIRMDRNDAGGEVFIRSLGSRGATGGLSIAATRAADVLDAAGYDPILIETVGSGQTETEIDEIAHTRVVVLPPGLGDEVQAMKSGLMEIADVFVVSKSDLPGADHTGGDLRAMLRLRGDKGRRAQVIETSIVDQRGIDRLMELLAQRAARRAPGLSEGSLARVIVRRAVRAAEDDLARLPESILVDLGARVRRGELTLSAAARAALDATRAIGPESSDTSAAAASDERG